MFSFYPVKTKISNIYKTWLSNQLIEFFCLKVIFSVYQLSEREMTQKKHTYKKITPCIPKNIGVCIILNVFFV